MDNTAHTTLQPTPTQYYSYPMVSSAGSLDLACPINGCYSNVLWIVYIAAFFSFCLRFTSFPPVIASRATSRWSQSCPQERRWKPANCIVTPFRSAREPVNRAPESRSMTQLVDRPGKRAERSLWTSPSSSRTQARGPLHRGFVVRALERERDGHGTAWAPEGQKTPEPERQGSLCFASENVHLVVPFSPLERERDGCTHLGRVALAQRYWTVRHAPKLSQEKFSEIRNQGSDVSCREKKITYGCLRSGRRDGCVQTHRIWRPNQPVRSVT